MAFMRQSSKAKSVQWTGKNLDECKAFLGPNFVCKAGTSSIVISTVKGRCMVLKGEYIIRSERSEFDIVTEARLAKTGKR